MKRIAVLAVSLLAVLSIGAPGAGASPSTIPEHFCQKPVRAAGQSYGTQGSGVRCNFISFWARRFIDHAGVPRGWRCVGLGESGECHKRHTPGTYFEYYALD